jgi:high-affinity iron transporter
MFAGSAAGVVLGALVGIALYSGLLTIPSRHLFAVSSALLILLAAGMAGQAAKFLIQADYLPPLSYLWDTSWLVANDSALGQVLGTLVGYDAEPAGMQLLFYLAVIGVLVGGTWYVQRSRPRSGAAMTTV